MRVHGLLRRHGVLARRAGADGVGARLRGEEEEAVGGVVGVVLGEGFALLELLVGGLCVVTVWGVALGLGCDV